MIDRPDDADTGTTPDRPTLTPLPDGPVLDRSQAILFREYGRSVQKMVHRMLETADRADRTRQARAIIEVMRIVSPDPGSDHVDYYQKLWDHLYAMSGYELDVETPFVRPDPAAVQQRPEPLPPPRQGVRLRNYGQHFEGLINKVINTEDPEERKGGIGYIGRLIKTFYAASNKDPMEDAVALRILREVSNGQLDLPLEVIQAEGLFAVRGLVPVHNHQLQSKGGQGPGGPPPQGRGGHQGPREGHREGHPGGQGGHPGKGRQGKPGKRRRY